MIAKRLTKVKLEIEKACEKVGRNPEEVRLLAVTKGHSVNEIAQAYDLGLRDFGENYATEMTKKQAALQARCPEIQWHFIGRIQSNKLRAIHSATWIHTLSDYKQAEALARLSAGAQAKRVLIQVNLDKDLRRSGVVEENLFALYARVLKIATLELRGLMTIAPISHEQEPSFWYQKMQTLRRELEDKLGQRVSEMSMGMSADFEQAIAFGATWLRIGTLIFGERERIVKD